MTGEHRDQDPWSRRYLWAIAFGWGIVGGTLGTLIVLLADWSV